jgi:NAD(P)H-flavin reductase
VDEEFGYEDNSDLHGSQPFTKSLVAPETSEEGTAEQPEQQCHHEASMISLHSTAGRPAFDELVEASETANYDSTAIYLCGPEMMIKSCKQAAGMGCQIAAERIQMAMNKNKFVFYEEKFEW